MRDLSGVIIVRNQDGDILLNFRELKQTSLQRMSAWHHCNPSPAMRKSLTSRKYVKADNKGEGSNSQHSQVSNDSRHWGKFGKSWNLGFPVPGVFDCTAHERAGMMTPDQWEARVTGLLTPDPGDCSEPEPEERERMSSGTQSAISSISPDTRQSGETIVQSAESLLLDHGSTFCFR